MRFEWPEPYRVLFPIGFACGLIGAGIWPLHAFGAIAYPGPLHRSLMMPGFEMSFVVGFLLTAMPAFTHGAKCRPHELLLAAAAMITILVAALFGNGTIAEAASGIALLVVMTALVSRLKPGEAAPPEEYKLVGFALILGLAGAALRLALALGAAIALPPWFAERLTSLGMLLSLVLGLGGLLVPTFAGLPQPLVIPGIAGPHERRGRRELYTITIVLLAAAFALELMRLPRAGAALRAVTATAIVTLVWKPWRAPVRGTVAAWTLWLSGWMIVVGLIGAALFPEHETAALHVTFLGGFAALTLGVGTRVVVSHGKHALALENTILTWPVVAALLLALACRLAAEAMPALATHWLGASGLLWWIAWGLWGVRALPMLAAARRVETIQISPPRSA